MPFLSFMASLNCTFFKILAQATMKCLVPSFLCANWYRIIRLSSIYSRYSAAVVAAMEQKLKSLQKFCRQTQKISSFTHHNVCAEKSNINSRSLFVLVSIPKTPIFMCFTHHYYTSKTYFGVDFEVTMLCQQFFLYISTENKKNFYPFLFRCWITRIGLYISQSKLY